MLQKTLPFLALLLILGSCGDDDDSDTDNQPTTSDNADPAAEGEGEGEGESEGEGEGEGPAEEIAAGETPPVGGPGQEHHVEGAEGEAPMPTGPETNLFSRGEIRLGVSSAGNPAEHGPARLVDGDNNTYWSSRAGDAVGSWLAFRVPDTVGVTKIRLVAGRRAQNGAWAPGPRIRKVEVFHNGTSKGEFTITGARAGFHDIAVSGVGGLWQVVVREMTATAPNAVVQVAELQVIGRRGEDSYDPYEPLPQRCRIGAVDSIFGQAAVGADGLRHSGTRNLAGDHSYAANDVPETDQLLRDLAQGAHTKPITPMRAIDFEGEGGNRVLFLLYGVDPNTSAQRESRRSATRPVDGGGHCYAPPEPTGDEPPEWIPCYELHLARFSLPANGLPSHDSSVQLGGDTCHISEVETELRDFDNDERVELLVRLTWDGTPNCPSGGAPTMVDELFLQLDTGMPQWQVQVSSNHPEGARSGIPIVRGRRTLRDVNADGKPDIVFAAHTEQCDWREGSNEPECNESDATTNYTYRDEIDVWMPEGEEIQMDHQGPPPGDAPPAGEGAPRPAPEEPATGMAATGMAATGMAATGMAATGMAATGMAAAPAPASAAPSMAP